MRAATIARTATVAPLRHPLDLPGIAFFVDAADAFTVTDAGAGAVSAWADQHPLANTLSEATNRPTTGTQSTPNGRNAIDFDGTNDKLVGANFAIHVRRRAITWFAVFKWDATGTGKCPFCFVPSGAASIPYQTFMVENNSGNYQVPYGTGSTSAGSTNYREVAFTAPGTTDYKRYIGFVNNLVEPKVKINGIFQTMTGVGSGIMSPSGFLSVDSSAWKPYIGQRSDGFFFDGKIACFGICQGTMSDVDQLRLDAWMAARFNV